MMNRPPKNDVERLQNLIEALAEPGDGEDALDEEMRKGLAKRGLTMESWAAEVRAKAQAVPEPPRRVPRGRLLLAAATLSLVAGGGGGIAMYAMREPTGEPKDGTSARAGAPRMELDLDAGQDADGGAGPARHRRR